MAVTIPELYKKKAEGKKITMLTAYDYPFAQMADEAGYGHHPGRRLAGRGRAGAVTTPCPVTMEEMLYHTTMVARAAKNALVVGDMPFLSYQVRSRGRA